MRFPSPPTLPIRQLLAALLTVVAAGCARWTRIPTPAPAAMPQATQFQLWVDRQAIVLRDVTVERDSIRERRADVPGARCKTWVVLPRAEVDSFLIRPTDRENWFGAGVTAGILAGIAITAAVFRGAAGN